MDKQRSYSIEESLKAQSALRAAAGMEPERFPVEAFVGMVSDEIEALRKQGRSDDEIAGIISQSGLEIDSSEITDYYASPELRHPGADKGDTARD